MEGPLRRLCFEKWKATLLLILFMALFPIPVRSQEQPSLEEAGEPTQMRLQKTVKTVPYHGVMVEGEEKLIRPGDTLWRILIQEKGLPQQRFGRYLVLIGSLNPQLKDVNLLRVGDTIFIPIRPDEILGIQVASGKGKTQVYRVREGDHLFKILRDQLGARDTRALRSAFDKVTELNPRKKNWNLIFVGEILMLPTEIEETQVAAAEAGEAPARLAATKAPAAKITGEIIDLEYGKRIPVHENLHLLEEVFGALGTEIKRGGEEVLPLGGGTVRIDRGAFPVIENPKLDRKVVLDTEGRIPVSLRQQVESQSSTTSVVTVEKGASLHDAVSKVFPHLGFQSLPADRPVVMRDEGVGLQVKGEWMVTTADQGSARSEMWIISLSDRPRQTPEYLRSYFSLKGMNLKEILLPSPPGSPPSVASNAPSGTIGNPMETWPVDKEALVDRFLESYGIVPKKDQPISLPLKEGIWLEAKIDRLFEHRGKQNGIVFRTLGQDVKKALQEKEGIRPVELDLDKISTRTVLGRLLLAVGEAVTYQRHNFPALDGGAKERLMLEVSGFYLPHRSALLTDREIPKALQPFFLEKGIRVIFFH